MNEETKPAQPEIAALAPKAKKTLDSKTKKAIIGVSVAGGSLVALLVTSLILGNLPTAAVNDGPNWSITKPGFYGKDANLILDSAGSSSSFFSFGKMSDSSSYGILGLTAPNGSQNLVIPSSFQNAGADSYSVSAIVGSASDSNVFGKSSSSDAVVGVYAPSLVSAFGDYAFANMGALTTVSLASAASGTSTLGM